MNEPTVSAFSSLSGSPTETMLAQGAYELFAGWNPGHPSEVRQMIMLAGVVFALLALGAMMIRSRWNVAIVVIISLAFVALVELWKRSNPSISQMTGAIRVIENGTAQTDRWTVFVSPIDATGAISWTEATVPLLSDQTGASRVSIERDRVGRPLRYRFHLRAGEKLAFVERSIEQSQELRPLFDNADPTFLEIVKRFYLRPDMRVLGRDNDTIVIAR